MKHRGDTKKRLTRILHIVRLLVDGKRVFTREMAYKFQVSQRSIQRDMRVLENAGWALYNRPLGPRSLWYWELVDNKTEGTK